MIGIKVQDVEVGLVQGLRQNQTYVVTLSKQFPKGHGRAGEPTRFRCAFLRGRDFCRDCFGGCDYDGNGKSSPGRTCSRMMWQYRKLHTIRANYPLWEKRFAEIERGEACLSVRQWTGKPYRSPQVEIGRLTHADGIGIQKFEDFSPFIYDIDNKAQAPEDLEQQLAHNDGLSRADWLDWFKGYDKTKPMAIIHFTNFRY